MSDATNARDPTQTRRSPTQILIGLPETFTYTQGRRRQRPRATPSNFSS